jgi:hypothetical protein
MSNVPRGHRATKSTGEPGDRHAGRPWMNICPTPGDLSSKIDLETRSLDGNADQRRLRLDRPAPGTRAHGDVTAQDETSESQLIAR